MKRACKLGCLVLACIGVTGLVVYFVPRPGQPYHPPAVAFEGDSQDLHKSIVVPTLDTPAAEGKNVVWCGTMQLAWNRLGKDVLHAQPDIEGAEAVATRLAEAPLREDDLPPDSYFVAAGFIEDGIVDHVKKEMRERFQEDVQFELMPEPDAVLVYSYLQSHMAFTIPFFDNCESFTFTDSHGTETQVSSFGIRPKDAYAYHELRAQVDVLYVHRKDQGTTVADEFILTTSVIARS